MSAVCRPRLSAHRHAHSYFQSSSHSSLEVLKQSLREEGPRFLFKGWTPAFIRLGPNTVFMFVFFEVRALFPRTDIANLPSMRSNSRRAGELSSLLRLDKGVGAPLIIDDYLLDMPYTPGIMLE